MQRVEMGHHPKQIHAQTAQGVMKILGTLSSLVREFAPLVRQLDLHPQSVMEARL
jgi:hypothetical protein